MKIRRALLRSCARCGVESAHVPILKGFNPKRLLMFFFALAFSPAGLVASNQIKDAQESARNLITKSITYYESNNLTRKAAEAWSEIAYCYWREGQSQRSADHAS